MSLVIQAATPKHEKAAVDVAERKRPEKKARKIGGDQRGVSRAEIYAVELQKKLIKGIDTTIKYLSKTAKKFPKKSAPRYDIQIKLLNLYLENAIYVSSEEHQNYNEEWDKWSARGRKGAEPKLSTSRSQSLWNEVKGQAEEIMSEYPTAKQADSILFNKALAEQFLGQEKSAAKTFSIIIRKYPNSPVTGDSYFALGDYFFEKNDFRNALSNFKSALKYKRAKRYGWALFKTGWSYFNLGKYKESLVYWKQTVSYAQTQKNEQGGRIKDEALRDMVYAFAELRMVDPAISYYRANGGHKYINGFLLLLASTFVDQGQFNQAVSVYKKFQNLYPGDEKAPESQKEVISLYFELGKYSLVWQELARLSSDYGPKSTWVSKNQKDRRLVLETQTMVKDQLIYYPKVVHSRAQKIENANAYKQALQGYQLFLKTYPTAKEVPEVKYLMADILYHKKQFRHSGQTYLEIAMLKPDDAVIYDAKTGKRENIHQKSAKYMLDSFLLDFEPQFKSLIKIKPNFSKPPRAMDPRAKNFIRGCEYYSKWYPKDKEAIKTCDIYVSEIYYRSNDKKQALSHLWLIATKYPDTKEGLTAVENIIPLYKEDQKGLMVAVEKLLKYKEYAKGAMGEKLRTLLWATENENIAKEKDTLKRAKLYEQQAKRNPKAPEADTLWNNAAVDYLAAGEIMDSIQAYKTLVDHYPKSKQRENSALQIPLLYEKMFKLKEAQAYFLKYSGEYPKSKKTPGALQVSCDIQIALSMPEAEKTCLNFVSKYPNSGPDVVFSLMQLAKRKKNLNQLSQLVFKEYTSRFKISANEKIVAYYMVYDLSQGKGGNGDLAFRGMMKEFKSNPKAVSGEALRYIGEIQFKAIGDPVSPYRNVRLKGGTVDNLLVSIQSLGAALEKLKSQYASVLESGDPYWGVAALCQIGSAYEYFADSLDNPPAIQGAKAEDVKAKLAPQVDAARKEALTYYANALATVTKYNVYSDWSVRAVNLHARAKGEKRSFDELVLKPDFLGVDIPGQLVQEVNK